MLADDAADFVFIGELRNLKGVEPCLSSCRPPGHVSRPGHHRRGRPGRGSFKRLAQRLGLNERVSFAGPQPARRAFARARCVVVPSRAESFPYIVLEAAAAQMPLIVTDVGGIPEIVAGVNMPLIPPGDVAALAGQMRAFLAGPKPFLDRAAKLQEIIAKRFTVANMTQQVVDFYISEVGAGVPSASASLP